MCFVSVFLLLNVFNLLVPHTFSVFPPPSEGDYRHLFPNVCVAIHAINERSHALSNVLGMFENWRFPKDRLRVKFFVEDKESEKKIERWSSGIQRPFPLYRSIEFSLINSNEEYTQNWREDALKFGRLYKCDYLFAMSSDDFITERALKQLVDFGEVVVSPLLNSPLSNGRYSNVEGLLTEEFIFREKIDLIRVYYASGPVLIWLKHLDSSYLTFDQDNLPERLRAQKLTNPIQIFALSAFAMNISIKISNFHFYGYTISSTYWQRAKSHQQIVGAFLANAVSDKGPGSYSLSSILPTQYPTKTKLGFDEIFLINLPRRPERLRKMTEVLALVGVDFRVFTAVDGKNLTDEELGRIKFLSGYKDPYHQRLMTRGEIGCFLSHYEIWKQILNQNEIERVLVLEDDVRFSENGTLVLDAVMEDLMRTHFEWDFIYLGRKKMSAPGDEFYVQGFITVGYSYWTLGYALSRSGAKKLVEARPLEKLLTLDEFLPIMYDRHPNKAWSKTFPKRDLRAYTIYPLVVEPERYTHQPGYVSDTESSPALYSNDEPKESSSLNLMNAEKNKDEL